MIHVFIGTKAQYVKTAPVLHELDRRGIEYNLIDSGQHSALSRDFRAYLGVRDPDVHLRKSDSDITTVLQMVRWFFGFLCYVAFRRKRVFEDVFLGQGGICLVHGDTPTTMLSALAAKRVGIKVAHLEAGLRSYNLWHPFPEEIIRILTMRITDYLFAPSQWAYDNILKMKVRGKAILLSGNTNVDTLRYVLARDEEPAADIPTDKPYVLFSIHRVETILRRKRLRQIVDLVKRVAADDYTVFCIHPPTRARLKKYGFDAELASTPNLAVRDLLPYPQFIRALKAAKYIVTDGGSVQEESFQFGTPCLLMRNRTERQDGIGENVCLAAFDDEKISHFLTHVEQFRITEPPISNCRPSAEIVDAVVDFEQELLPMARE